MSEREELRNLRILVRAVLDPLKKGEADIEPKAIATRVLQGLGGEKVKKEHPLIYLASHHFIRNIIYSLLRGRPRKGDTGAQPELPFPDFKLVRGWYPRAHKKGQQAKWAPIRKLELVDAKWNVDNFDREIDPMVDHKEQFIKVCVTKLGFPESELRKKDGGEAVDVG